MESDQENIYLKDRLYTYVNTFKYVLPRLLTVLLFVAPFALIISEMYPNVVLVSIFILCVSISLYVSSKVRWRLSPNLAPVRIKVGSSEVQIIINCKNPEIARGYIRKPPLLNLTAFGGLAWLSANIDKKIEEKFFEILALSNYKEIAKNVQEEKELREQIIQETIALSKQEAK